MNELIERIIQTPSIQDAINRGEYTIAEAEAEFRDRIMTGDVTNGLLYKQSRPSQKQPWDKPRKEGEKA